jgi:D-3-phosphoglycerate dehydrogenase
MSPVRVLVTPRSLTQAGLDAVPELEPLRRMGAELIGAPPGRAPTEEQLLELVPGCVGWLAGIERISDRVLRAASTLRIICRNGSGTDSIDLAAAERAGIRVERATGANAQGVAELALGLALTALRNVPWESAAVRRGEWHRSLGTELADCTVGVIGLGAVGKRSASLFASVGANVVAHDPFLTEAEFPRIGLGELLTRCDVVTLHCPPAPDGRPLLDSARLGAARRGVVVVNTARSVLVDEDAMLTALTAGQVAAYAVDAFASEPPEPSALLGHDRVLATPHIGGYTASSVRRATQQAVASLMTHLEPR